MAEQFHTVRIEEVRRETADAVSVMLDLPEELRTPFAFTPGQYLTFRADIEGEEVRRNYSICSAPSDGQWRVAIKHLPGGRFSGWANTALSAGDTIEVMPPSGAFTWAFDPQRAARYALFASGSGITPVLSLLKQGLRQEPHSQFALFYGNRDTNNILFLEELAALKDQYLNRFEMYHFLSREEDELDIFNGRIDSAKMDRIIHSMIDPERLTAAFVCGPEGMMDAVEQALVSAGMASDSILSERFAAGELSEEQKQAMAKLEQQAAGRPMTITIDGRRRKIAFDPDHISILENARSAGVRAPFSCKAGMCATCRARVVSGKVEMIRNFGLTEDEVEQGYVLTCQAIPVSDNVEIDFDV